jgi:hypothetical protein
LDKSKKVVYLGHRRFLLPKYQLKKKGKHFNGEAEVRGKPKADFFWASRVASRSQTAEAQKKSLALVQLISTVKLICCVFLETGPRPILESFPSFSRRKRSGTHPYPFICFKLQQNATAQKKKRKNKKTKRYPLR